MAANRLGFPTPPGPGEDHSCCPVCGWNPCTDECRLGLSRWDVEDLDGFWDCPEALEIFPELEFEVELEFELDLDDEEHEDL